jgi:hypothetical protein
MPDLRGLAVAALCGALVGGAFAAGALAYILGPKE